MKRGSSRSTAARRVPGWVWLAQLASTLLLGACAARPPEPPEVADTAGAERERELCTAPRKATRLYVGFDEGMTLDHFELAAFEAERITATLLGLCELGRQAADADLRAALAAGALEITAIEFLRDDASAARVRLERVEPAEPESWRLEVARTPAGWQLLSATRSPAPGAR